MWKQWQWRGAPHSPKLHHHWNLTIRLFSFISGHSFFWVGGLTPVPRCSWCILQPQPTGQDPSDHWVKIKENKTPYKYLNFDRELKKSYGTKRWSPIVIGSPGMSPKAWKGKWKGWKLEDEWRLFKLLICWDKPEYSEESWKLKEICCHSDSRERPSAKPDVKNLLRVISYPKEFVNPKIQK